MTSDYLKALKLKKNLTNQELSDLSGVPVGTINRIMANQTDNPSFQTVCDIVIALDGSLDELAGIRPKKDSEAENAKYTPEIEAIYKQMIHSKDKWIFSKMKMLFRALCRSQTGETPVRLFSFPRRRPFLASYRRLSGIGMCPRGRTRRIFMGRT